MAIIIIGFVLWLIYDYYKDRKIEKELQEIKQDYIEQQNIKGGAE